MKKLSPLYTGLFALTVAFAGPIGCAAETGDEAEESVEDDLTAAASKSNILGEVYAIKIDDKTLGAKTKVAGVLNAMEIASRDAMPAIATAMPRCMLSHPITFIGAKGKQLGYGGFMCGASETTGIKTAYVTVGSKTYQVKADLGAVFKQVDKPVQAGDLLYNVTAVTITKPGHGLNPKASTETASTIKDVLAAISQTVTPVDPNAPVPRCIPARVLTFYRGDKEAATLTTMCSAATGTGSGNLFTPDDDKLGKVTIDFTKLGKVESILRWSR